MLKFENVSFRYPGQEKDVIQNISFELKTGEFVLLCGESGCGKTTLLRHAKKNQIPVGKGSGKMFFCGEDLERLDDRRSVSEIGYVGQSPDGQIVTDTVWHELAFGLESIGAGREQMYRRIAEMSEYFGISSWYDRKTTELSGGQKQILNLASVMVMHPKLLLLDEPTSQLDPIAAEKFLQNIYKLNRDFGVTILICEQRIHEVIPMADMVMLMQEGKLVSFSPVKQSVLDMKRLGSRVYDALPGFMRLWCEYGEVLQTECPRTIRDAKRWLSELTEEMGYEAFPEKIHREKNTEILLKAREAAFSYQVCASKRKGWLVGSERNGEMAKKPVLKNLSITVESGKVYAVMGGNGSGKTTALKLLAGIYQPLQGVVERRARVVYLAQNPKTVFTEITVHDELYEVFAEHPIYAQRLSGEEIEKRLAVVMDKMELSAFCGQHPFDLSAGQQQRLALAKVLLLEPEVLLLDEPTKGLDGMFKSKLAKYLEELASEGLAIVMVSHDITFCAEYADLCGLLFDGELTEMKPAEEFFRQNYFYTTDICRMFSDGQTEAETGSIPVKYSQAQEMLKQYQ